MTTTRRPGVSLLEVLVAIFIVAIGLLALLTLFPLGALRMGQALKDDRTAQTAVSADSVLRAYWRHNVLLPVGDPKRDEPLIKALSDPFNPHPDPKWGPTKYRAFVQPQPPAAYTATYPVVLPTVQEPSYPVLIDPLGLFARSPNDPEQYWTAYEYTRRNYPVPPNPPVALLPRRNLSMAITQAGPPPSTIYTTAAVQTCCLVDDFSFQSNGSAGDPANPGLTRQGRYSWAAVIQRPSNASPDAVTLKVLVFDGRPPLLASPDDEVAVPLTYPLTVGDRSVTLSVPNRGTDQTPLVRKGGWIMDGTIDNASGIRHANFYRVVGVTEGGPDPTKPNNSLFTLDLETEIKRTDGRPGQFPLSANVFPRIYLFAGLAEVFDRPALQPDPIQ